MTLIGEPDIFLWLAATGTMDRPKGTDRFTVCNGLIKRFLNRQNHLLWSKVGASSTLHIMFHNKYYKISSRWTSFRHADEWVRISWNTLLSRTYAFSTIGCHKGPSLLSFTYWTIGLNCVASLKISLNAHYIRQRRFGYLPNRSSK